jgi:aspartokinase
LVADPRIIKDAKPIKVITYRELRELSYMGASVLHEDAIFPVRHAGIPINIKNTNAPEDDGTMIVANTVQKAEYTITGIVVPFNDTVEIAVTAMESTPTGIENINAEIANDAPIFNIAGQRVEKAVKGINIQNGKKFIVK